MRLKARVTDAKPGGKTTISEYRTAVKRMAAGDKRTAKLLVIAAYDRLQSHKPNASRAVRPGVHMQALRSPPGVSRNVVEHATTRVAMAALHETTLGAVENVQTGVDTANDKLDTLVGLFAARPGTLETAVQAQLAVEMKKQHRAAVKECEVARKLKDAMIKAEAKRGSARGDIRYDDAKDKCENAVIAANQAVDGFCKKYPQEACCELRDSLVEKLQQFNPASGAAASSAASSV